MTPDGGWTWADAQGYYMGRDFAERGFTLADAEEAVSHIFTRKSIRRWFRIGYNAQGRSDDAIRRRDG